MNSEPTGDKTIPTTSLHRQVVILVHPDKNTSPRAPEAFKKVTRAFQVLRDPDRRALYDRCAQQDTLKQMTQHM